MADLEEVTAHLRAAHTLAICILSAPNRDAVHEMFLHEQAWNQTHTDLARLRLAQLDLDEINSAGPALGGEVK